MRPVQQCNVAEQGGDCFAACVASILELPLERVPNYHTEEGKRSVWDRWRSWLAPANLSLIVLHNHGPVPGYAIRSIPSYVYEASLHAVVMYGGGILWDPSPRSEEAPDDAYLTYARQTILTLLDPLKPVDLSVLPAADADGVPVNIYGISAMTPGLGSEATP